MEEINILRILIIEIYVDLGIYEVGYKYNEINRNIYGYMIYVL